MSVKKVPSPGAASVAQNMARLRKMRLLVGIPGDAGNQPGSKVPLAVVGYIQELGDDELRIPARPFLVPGTESVKDDVAKQMAYAAAMVLAGAPAAAAAAQLQAAGTLAVAAVKKRMNEGPFAPLAPATIAARARRRDKDTGKLVNYASARNARQYLKLQAQGVPTEVLSDSGVGLAKPLIDKGDLIRNIQSAVDGV